MKKNYLLLLSLFVFSVTLALAKKDDGKVVVIQCTDFHITKPLREIVKEFPVDENKIYLKKESEDREGREPQKFPKTVEDGPEYGNNPAVIQTKMGDITGRAPITNWPGQTASGFRPYDPSGAAGPSHYVQMINSTTFKVYNKITGAVSLTATLGSLWSPATSNDGDPIVLYDKTADRWFLAQFGQTGNKMYIAISQTPDPTGAYYTYTYTSPAFPDYLKFSVWTDGYYMTSNQAQKVFCFDRTAMLSGDPASRSIYVSFSPPQSTGFFCPLPGDAADGVLPPAGTPCPIFSYSDNGWGGSFTDAVNIYQMAVNWVPTTPTASITLAANVPTTTFDASYNASWNDISQPGTTQKLDGIGGVCMFRSQWKSWTGYNTVVLNWGVKISATQRSIKWCELRQDQTTGVWSLYQEGIYTPDAATRWMGAIAMDNNGSIGLVYLKSDATSIFPGLYYTGRRDCDPLGVFTVAETQVIAGTGSQTGGNRDGDYSQLSLDPDGITFWFTGEYMGGSTGSSAARTQIFSFQIPGCSNSASVYVTQTNGTNPQCPGSSATFTAIPGNGGVSPSYQWKVNGSNVGTNSNTYTSSTLNNNDVITCVMTSSIVGMPGSPATSNAITMLVNSVVTPTVSIAQTGGSNPACAGTTLTFTASPTNGGTTPSYQWKVNGGNVGTNSATYSSSTLTNGQIVSCVLTSSALCTTTPTANSNSITMTINAQGNPTVSISQTGGTNPLCAGSAAVFTATVAGGSAPSYQWQVNGINSGTNSPSFSTTALTDGQTVSCSVTATPTCPLTSGVTLGTGTSLSSTTSGLASAYPSYYGNGRQQYLIRASELTGLGFTSGPINSLGFTINGTLGDPDTLNGYTIKMALVAATTLNSTFQAPTFTTVYGPVNYLPALSSLNTHTFTTPFTWNGTSNVLIDICFSNQVVGITGYQSYYTTSTFVSTTYYQADDAAGAGACSQASASGAGGTGSRRPNMVIGRNNGSGNANSNILTMSITALPAISSFAPASGSPGTSVIITGSGFAGVNNVLFNGTPATSFTVNSSTQITAIAPSSSNGPITVVTSPCGNAISASSFSYSTGITLNLKIFIEGFYLGGGEMIGIISPSITDTLTVELALAVAPYTILYSDTKTISTLGNGAFSFPSAAVGSSYYIVVKHRNGLECWSGAPLLCNTSVMTYDFSSLQSKAYGGNIHALGDGFFAIWSGDVNQDGFIESSDYSSVENSSQIFLFGYVNDDLTGDGIVESADYSLIENNSQLFLIVARP
ncbi:MAG: IPT/TIG domain-containing protein [Bacteroidetes bacterium]|nr:IPT/TIG domain-containing protein [Bacteroidota bacterium]